MVFLIVLLIMSTLLVAPCSASLPAVVRSRVRAATLGGLVGDALALAFHYEYDAGVIAGQGRQTDFLAPKVNYGVSWGRANYHPGKVAGDMTVCHWPRRAAQRQPAHGWREADNVRLFDKVTGAGVCNYTLASRLRP